jgi:hypothetical protein
MLPKKEPAVVTGIATVLQKTTQTARLGQKKLDTSQHLHCTMQFQSARMPMKPKAKTQLSPANKEMNL